MHCRDHVEEMIVERLNRRFPDDEYVNEYEYIQLINRLDVVMWRVLDEVHIPSFTDEDLVSFMRMKAHQLLRRGSIDLERGKVSTLAYTSFRNLCRDIIRMQDRAWRRGLTTDPLDHTPGSRDSSRAPFFTISYQLLEGQEQGSNEDERILSV